jgi:integrase
MPKAPKAASPKATEPSTAKTEKKLPAALTELAIKKYRPGRERRRIRDGLTPGLFLIIEPSGHRSWQMRFRRPSAEGAKKRPGKPGKPGKITLGPVDLSGNKLKDEPQIGHIGTPLSLTDARLLAQKVLRERQLGHDPIADHKARKHHQRAALESRDASTFAACLRDYIAEQARPKTRRWRETARWLGLFYGDAGEPTVIRAGLAARWGDRTVASISSDDIWEVIDEARRHGVPGLAVRNNGLSDARARMLFVALAGLFKWLVKERRLKVNPCIGLSRPEKATTRDRVLSDAELRWFWLATDAADGPRVPNAPRPFAPLLKLLLLTGCRLREVSGMRRDELRDDGATWSLPGLRTKNGLAHIVPLPPLVRELIARVGAEGDLIFSTTGSTPVSGFSRMKRRFDKVMLEIARKEKRDAVIAPWRLHDLRRSCATGMAEIGVAPHIVEACLNHVSGAKAGVAGIYNRAAYAPEKKIALERWAAHVESIVAERPAEVVLPFKRGRK